METNIQFARQLDVKDPLQALRQLFHLPQKNGESLIYFCGNSLGLQPKNIKPAVEQELEDWKNFVIEGFTRAKNPWLYYHHYFKDTLSNIAGCYPHELTVMNALTVNLHLLLFSFYRPANTRRFKIIMEAGAFPADQYAVETQVKLHGFLPENAVIEITPREGEYTLHTEDILQAIDEHRQNLALVLMGGIHYYTGQCLDMQAITQAAHQAGAFAGFDLAHAIGNIPLQLHEWEVDFAVWCSYKYLNAGPGAVGGAYIHERYGFDKDYPRAGGWWGNDEQTRFEMQKGFIPKPGADGWQVSTAQVMNMVSLKASMEIFAQTNMQQLRAKSEQLTGYLEYLLKQINSFNFTIITPGKKDERGAQLSLFFPENGKEIYDRLTRAGVVCDWREPGVIRVAPTAMYNSFSEVYRFYEILQHLD
jgi:kynureninase